MVGESSLIEIQVAQENLQNGVGGKPGVAVLFRVLFEGQYGVRRGRNIPRLAKARMARHFAYQRTPRSRLPPFNEGTVGIRYATALPSIPGVLPDMKIWRCTFSEHGYGEIPWRPWPVRHTSESSHHEWHSFRFIMS